MSKSKSSVITLATVGSLKASLQAQLAAAEQQEKELKANELAKLTDKVNGLPKLLSVNTLGEVIALIKHVEKGTLGVESGPGRAYKQLTEAEDAALIADLTAGGPANQVSALAVKYGVSEGTVWRKKKEAGLTAAKVTV